MNKCQKSLLPFATFVCQTHKTKHYGDVASVDVKLRFDNGCKAALSAGRFGCIDGLQCTASHLAAAVLGCRRAHIVGQFTFDSSGANFSTLVFSNKQCDKRRTVICKTPSSARKCVGYLNAKHGDGIFAEKITSLTNSQTISAISDRSISAYCDFLDGK